MRIEDRFFMKGRGWVVTGHLEEPGPKPGDILRRHSDGQTWRIRGVESFLLPRPLRNGDNIGLLVDGDAPPVVGDVVSFEAKP